jgi:hypothetical protein
MLDSVRDFPGKRETSEGRVSVPESATEDVANPSGITFPVDDVEQLDGQFWLTDLRDSLELRTGGTIFLMPEHDRPALAAEGYMRPRKRLATNPLEFETLPLEAGRHAMARMLKLASSAAGTGVKLRPEYLHPLVQAVDLAFAEHRPLVLSPDSFWMAIVQGFGHHVDQNSDALRSRIVRHEGKKTLEVSTDSLDEVAWPGLVSQFSQQIRDSSDPVLHETLLCEFSTTTPHIRTALQVALMDLYQEYFEYEVMCVCGIPRITLQGTVEDWKRMCERVEVLAAYDLEWWTCRLRLILEQFVATAQGNPDREFWKAIYKPERPYGADTATGWIADVFPYLFYSQNGPRRLNSQSGWRRNPVLSQERTEWRLPKTSHRMASNGVNIKHFPSGLSRAPVNVQFHDGSGRPKVEVDLVGGFFGVGIRENDQSLHPILSWALVGRGLERAPGSIGLAAEA